MIGGIRSAESRALFVEWMDMHEGDESREEQRKFITQLLTLTAGEPTAAITPSEASALG